MDIVINSENVLKFSVKDTGIGLDEIDLIKLRKLLIYGESLDSIG